MGCTLRHGKHIQELRHAPRHLQPDLQGKDRILRGAKKADGTYEYESHVDYWMPFNGGIGFHDATWRSKFGGTIFQTSGSHGCINLPPEKASVLYDLIYKGMPVLCYQ